MKRVSTYLMVAALFCTPLSALAEQEVTLKSGVSLVGNVTIEGSEVVIDIDGAKMRVPFAEVDTIGSVDIGHQRQARRLLLTALEAKLAKDTGTEVIGLLAEAARLAPDDPHIAYWYANSLADAGFGMAASDVLEKRRAVIAKAYPGMIDHLAKRIKKRVEMENMPPVLVERLDKMNVAAANRAEDAEMRHLMAVFRLVDQDDRGIERSAFNIQCNGQDQNLEVFDDGYFVFTFNQHRSNNNEPCRMEVVQPGLESKTFEFSGGTTRVQDAGKLVVRRYDEKSKGTFRFTLVSADAKPVAGAELKLQPISQRGSTAHVLTAESDGEGRAEILAYPLRYTYSVQAEGFNYESGNVEMKSEAAGGSEKQIQLHPAIQATVRVAWLSTMGGGKTSSEATLQVDGGPPAPYRYGQDTTSWIRPLQVKDQLTLQLHDNPFGFGGPYAAAEPWVRVIEAKGEGEDVDVLEEFTTLDLNKIDELKEKLRAPRIASGNQLPGNPRPPIAVTAEPGKIYVGRLQHRDMRTGQPVQLAFKAMVEEIAAADASAE